MKAKTALLVTAVFVLAILLVSPAYAGGWAVITVDHLPTDVTANQPVEISFTVRQHGQHPMPDLEPLVEASLVGSTESISVDAHPTKKAGQYSAELTFPQAGTWDWHIQAFTMEQPMPQLKVQAAVVVDNTLAASTPALVHNLWLAGLGLLGMAAASVLILRKNVRWAITLLVAALLLTGGGFAITRGLTFTRSLTLAALQAPDLAPEMAPEAKSIFDPRSLIQYGEDLFLAKGCVTCHYHSAMMAKNGVFGVGSPGTPVGTGSPPDLSSYTTSPEYLLLWLANPDNVRPGTDMPDLELSADEVDALIAFLLE